MNSLWILLFTSLYTLINSVYIEENGYRDVTISFSENILKESEFDFLKFKNILTNASDILFHATKKRSYFKDFLLVVPAAWLENDICDEFVAKSPKNIDIYVTDSSDVSSVTTQHSKGCGEKGEIIYLSKDWMAGDEHELSLQFVQQWSTFRYGVFPENPERNRSCMASPDLKWSPTGCYNIDLDMEPQFDENGLPMCDLPNDFSEQENLSSSIMFSATNSSKMLNFCDGESFPHDPIAPTLHNRICRGYSVWSVIENTGDFKYRRNSPMISVHSPNKPTFRCFNESKSHLTIMIQETDSEARSEIRYALVYFLSIIESADFAVSLATFSSNERTDKEFTDIDLQNKENLKSLLESKVKLKDEIPDVCLTCGFRKAYKVSESSQYTTRAIILIARESALNNMEFSEITEIIQQDENAMLYILFLEDTANDIIPSSLVETIQGTGGRIFRLKNEPVLMLTELTTALLDASKNVLHIEDKILVVHKKTYVNVTSDISDVFSTPKNIKGKLLYAMQFKKRGEFKYDMCEDMDKDLPSPICGNQTDLDNDVEAKVWKYTFDYSAGSKGTTCSSLALLKLESPSKNSFTVKGWLSDNKIIPGQNTLVIYAEIHNRLNYDVKVEARISGPGLEDFQLELRDNGNGDPDVIKGDSIYSRYFTTFSEKGTYTVSIIAEALVSKNGNMTVKRNTTDVEMKMTQTKAIGTFRVIKTPPKEDILPPNRICDLKVIRVDSSNKTILLQWTAPGDDYDYGKAKKYTIKLSNNWMVMMDSMTFNLRGNILLEPEENEPANSGVTENIPVQCFTCNINEIYYIALQTTDNNYNKGKVSNIVQIFFNGVITPPTDPDELSTDTTNIPTEKTASTGFTTTVEENTTITNGNYTKDGIFIEKNIFIASVSSLGAFILILIIINIIICYCCRKKRQLDKPKKLSKKASLQPPHNLNIAYKQGSESSLNDEQVVSNSLSTLVDQSTVFSSFDDGSLDKRYSYHTDRSLRNKMESENKKSDLGFKLVKPMPAYASSSLSRFVARQRDIDNDLVSKANTVELSKLNTSDTHIYSLGQV